MPGDTGTGSNFKGMLVFDLAILQNTALLELAHELANLKSLKEIELWRINKLSDISFISELTNLEIIKLQDLKHVTSLPDLSRHPNLQRVFLIDTGINVKELPNYLQEKVSNWDDR